MLLWKIYWIFCKNPTSVCSHLVCEQSCTRSYHTFAWCAPEIGPHEIKRAKYGTEKTAHIDLKLSVITSFSSLHTKSLELLFSCIFSIQSVCIWPKKVNVDFFSGGNGTYPLSIFFIFDDPQNSRKCSNTDKWMCFLILRCLKTICQFIRNKKSKGDLKKLSSDLDLGPENQWPWKHTKYKFWSFLMIFVTSSPKECYFVS